MKKFLRKTSGVLLVGLGIAGLILPILQGTPFLILGVSILSPEWGAKLKRRIFLGRTKNAVLPLEEWKERAVSAGFTTRLFPAHLSSTDDLNREESRAALRSLFPQNARPERFAYVKQVHGNRVLPVSRLDFMKGDFVRMGEADALVTIEPKTALVVLSADCLPVFFIALRGEKTAAVALAHAGWRGTKERIAVRTLERLRELSGVRADGIRVALGPSIDFKNYPVGEEFTSHFLFDAARPKKSPLKRVGGRLHFDLRLENKRQLIEAGLPAKNLIDTELSTVSRNKLFYSFRLEKEKAGRTVSFIWIA